MRSWTIAGAIALGMAAIVIVFLPFRAPNAGRAGYIGSPRCDSPVVSAWRAPAPVSGWFGYAPLTSTPLESLVNECKRPARHRLVDAGVFAVGAVLLVRPRRRGAGKVSVTE